MKFDIPLAGVVRGGRFVKFDIPLGVDLNDVVFLREPTPHAYLRGSWDLVVEVIASARDRLLVLFDPRDAVAPGESRWVTYDDLKFLPEDVWRDYDVLRRVDHPTPASRYLVSWIRRTL